MFACICGDQWQVSPSIALYITIKAGPLSEPGAHQLWACLCLPSLGLPVCATTLGFCYCQGLELRSLRLCSSSLLTEQCLLMQFKIKCSSYSWSRQVESSGLQLKFQNSELSLVPCRSLGILEYRCTVCSSHMGYMSQALHWRNWLWLRAYPAKGLLIGTLRKPPQIWCTSDHGGLHALAPPIKRQAIYALIQSCFLPLSQRVSINPTKTIVINPHN